MLSKVQEEARAEHISSTFPEDFSEPSEPGTPPSGILSLEPVFDLCAPFNSIRFLSAALLHSMPCCPTERPSRVPASVASLTEFHSELLRAVNLVFAASTEGHP